MTAPLFLRRFEPALFGTTSPRSRDLRRRVGEYTGALSGGPVPGVTGLPLSAPDSSGRGVARPSTATGALSLTRKSNDPSALSLDSRADGSQRTIGG